jgi:hypothetical protein
MANRITAAFARMDAQIADRIANGLTTAEKVRDVHKTLDMDIGEHAKFQTLKTLAVAQGLLTLEEGISIYAALGESVQTFNNQPIHIKSVLTSFFAELLKAQIQQRGGRTQSRLARRQSSAQPGEVSC